MSHPDRTGSADLRKALSAAFGLAMARGEISTAFQPKVTLATRELVGVEALARWNSPQFGRVPPEVFVPLAEEHALIGDLTDLVLADALDTCAVLRRHAPDITMAVNISPRLLAEPTLAARLDCALAHADLPASALIVEVTESQIIEDMAGAAVTLTDLRRRGIGCAIDDFGTGHASLLTLLRLPFSELKIDRAFIGRCATDREAEIIVRATLGLAREMNLHVVAEGIETEDTETALRGLGCQTGQGFRYGQAVDAGSLVTRLRLNAGSASALAQPHG